MAEVALKGLSKSFGEVHVIRDMDLTIRDQEFLVLVGPSGCGKSTVLRMIAGLESATTGTIVIDAKVVNDVPPKDRDIAMVFQNYALYPHMNVFENMAFALKMRKVAKPEIQSRVQEAATLLELQELLRRKPKELSGGQRQRVALGRCIVRNPKVFLMDEPLSNLDAKLRHQMRSEISKLHQRLKATTIYVTHDQVEAMTMGHRIVVLNKGIVQQVDTPVTVYEHPSNLFVAGFIGQMNFLKGVVDSGCFVLPEGERFQLPESLVQKARSHEGKPVILGVRPEHFSPATSDAAGESLSVQPDHVETLGSEKLVYFKLAGDSVMAKLPMTVEIPATGPVLLKMTLDRASLFDAETQQAF